MSALGLGQSNELHDNYQKRHKVAVSDETVIEAANRLSAAQFEAWKMATVHGYSDIEISDAMCTYSKAVLPKDVRDFLQGAARNGFVAPGVAQPKARSREKVSA